MRHEYATIAATMLSNKLASIALSPEMRPRLIQRSRQYARRGLNILDEWLKGHAGVFDLVPPQAAAIAFVRYHLEINSSVLSESLRTQKDVLVIPGDDFGIDYHLRISFGPPPDYLREGLERVHDLILEMG